MKKLLPLGSIVLLENAVRKTMVISRLQVNVKNGQEYDYSGCVYPEGKKQSFNCISKNVFLSLKKKQNKEIHNTSKK